MLLCLAYLQVTLAICCVSPEISNYILYIEYLDILKWCFQMVTPWKSCYCVLDFMLHSGNLT